MNNIHLYTFFRQTNNFNELCFYCCIFHSNGKLVDCNNGGKFLYIFKIENHYIIQRYDWYECVEINEPNIPAEGGNCFKPNNETRVILNKYVYCIFVETKRIMLVFNAN